MLPKLSVATYRGCTNASARTCTAEPSPAMRDIANASLFTCAPVCFLICLQPLDRVLPPSGDAPERPLREHGCIFPGATDARDIAEIAELPAQNDRGRRRRDLHHRG